MRTALAAALLGLAGLAAAAVDPRSLELLRFDCASRIASRELTLFANGTLRLREERVGEERRMRLAELGSGELAAYLARLAGEDLVEVDLRGPELSGDWVEACEVVLALPERPPRRLRFGLVDSLPLALGRVLAVVDDLMVEVETRSPRSRLPADYEPRPGDRLRRIDGAIFEVVAFTGDGAGVELLAVDIPLVIFVPRAALRDEFEELLGRRP